MDFKKEIIKIGIKNNKLADKLGIKVALFSHYLNDRATMPDDIKTKLTEIINAYKRAEMSI